MVGKKKVGGERGGGVISSLDGLTLRTAVFLFFLFWRLISPAFSVGCFGSFPGW